MWNVVQVESDVGNSAVKLSQNTIPGTTGICKLSKFQPFGSIRARNL
jgi:hypothetical protein